jgi:hypothetical protein
MSSKERSDRKSVMNLKRPIRLGKWLGSPAENAAVGIALLA